MFIVVYPFVSSMSRLFENPLPELFLSLSSLAVEEFSVLFFVSGLADRFLASLVEAFLGPAFRNMYSINNDISCENISLHLLPA